MATRKVVLHLVVESLRCSWHPVALSSELCDDVHLCSGRASSSSTSLSSHQDAARRPVITPARLFDYFDGHKRPSKALDTSHAPMRQPPRQSSPSYSQRNSPISSPTPVRNKALQVARVERNATLQHRKPTKLLSPRGERIRRPLATLLHFYQRVTNPTGTTEATCAQMYLRLHSPIPNHTPAHIYHTQAYPCPRSTCTNRTHSPRKRWPGRPPCNTTDYTRPPRSPAHYHCYSWSTSHARCALPLQGQSGAVAYADGLRHRGCRQGTHEAQFAHANRGIRCSHSVERFRRLSCV